MSHVFTPCQMAFEWNEEDILEEHSKISMKLNGCGFMGTFVSNAHGESNDHTLAEAVTQIQETRGENVLKKKKN